MSDDNDADSIINRYFDKATEFLEKQELLKNSKITPEEDEKQMLQMEEFEKQSKEATSLEIRKVEALEKIALNLQQINKKMDG